MENPKPVKDRHKPRLGRAPLIGDPHLRTRKTELQLTPDEIAALDELWRRRRCLSRSDYLRLLIEADWYGNLMMIDDGFAKFAEAIGRGFGGAAAELTAQADAYRLQKGLSEL